MGGSKLGRVLTIQLRTCMDVSPPYDALKYLRLEQRGVLRGAPAGKLTIRFDPGWGGGFGWEFQHVHKNYLLASDGTCKMAGSQMQLWSDVVGKAVGEFDGVQASFGQGIQGLNPLFVDGIPLNKWNPGFRAVAFDPDIHCEWKLVNVQKT